MPRISIIIPIKNRANLIGVTLDNILAQTLPAHEIIVVDDGSTDNLSEAIEKYGNKITLIKSKGHGPGAARNTGMEIATGEYIKFFDSDDVMTTNTLEVQYVTIEKHKAPMVYSPYVYSFFESEKWHQKDVIIQHKPIPTNKTIHDCMTMGFFTVIPGMMFTKSFINKLGAWCDDIIAYEDWDYLWRIGNFVGNPIHTNDCCMFYRVHQNQTTSANFTNHDRDKDKITCLTNALSGKMTFKNKLLLKAELEKTLKLVKNNPVSTTSQIINQYKRLRNKTERLITHSDWERMHGICANIETFEKYLKML